MSRLRQINWGDKPEKLLLLSGGLDSVVMFHDLLQSGMKFRCMWIDYGQKNARAEQKVVTELCTKHMIALQSVFCPVVFEQTRSSLLATGVGEHSVRTDEIKFRNGVLAGIAASHCTQPTTILIGAHKTSAAYADATPTFYIKLSRVIHWGTNSQVDVEAPYIRMTKKQILDRAWDIALTPSDLALSVSCYDGNNCGKCPACKARMEALRLSKFHRY